MGSGAHYDGICLPAVWKLSAFAHSSPSLSLVTVSIWSASISTDTINGVPDGCHSQGCHGYLHALLEAHIVPHPLIPKAPFPSSSIGDEFKGWAHNL